MADVTLVAGTLLPYWAPKIADNITDRNGMLEYYKERDRKVGPDARHGYHVVDGGREFRESIFSAVNGTFRGYNDREDVDTTEGNPIKEAQYTQKIVAGSINISLLEQAQNTEKYQIHNLLETKREEAEYSMSEIVGASALSDGTTDTKIPHGLQLIITSSGDNTVGTITSTASFWRPQRDTSGVTAWNTSDEGMIQLDAIYQNCTRSPEEPDLIVTTQAVKTLINVMVIKNLTININAGKDRGDLGYGDVYYRKAKVISDDNVPTGTLYLVNSRYLRFQVLKGGNFEMTKMKQPIGGLYSVAQLYVFCNWTCGARRLQGVMTAITG